MNTETHPFEPFLPENAKVLFLGSFPPQPKRWSMPFYYPNWINDFWRIMGLIYYENKDQFVIAGQKRFDQARIEAFCKQQGFALYDTACEVRRLQDNASDKYLEIVTPTDIVGLLKQIPKCEAIVTTGQKATDVIVNKFGCPEPSVGKYVEVSIEGRKIKFWRMPSTSRAYPLPLEQKAQFYREMLMRGWE